MHQKQFYPVTLCLWEQGQHWSTQVCVIMTEKIVCGKNPSHASGAKTTNQYKKSKLLHSIIYCTKNTTLHYLLQKWFHHLQGAKHEHTNKNNSKKQRQKCIFRIVYVNFTELLNQKYYWSPANLFKANDSQTVYFRNWTLSAACYRHNYTDCVLKCSIITKRSSIKCS